MNFYFVDLTFYKHPPSADYVSYRRKVLLEGASLRGKDCCNPPLLVERNIVSKISEPPSFRKLFFFLPLNEDGIII